MACYCETLAQNLVEGGDDGAEVFCDEITAEVGVEAGDDLEEGLMGGGERLIMALVGQDDVAGGGGGGEVDELLFEGFEAEAGEGLELVGLVLDAEDVLIGTCLDVDVWDAGFG